MFAGTAVNNSLELSSQLSSNEAAPDEVDVNLDRDPILLVRPGLWMDHRWMRWDQHRHIITRPHAALYCTTAAMLTIYCSKLFNRTLVCPFAGGWAALTELVGVKVTCVSARSFSCPGRCIGMFGTPLRCLPFPPFLSAPETSTFELSWAAMVAARRRAAFIRAFAEWAGQIGGAAVGAQKFSAIDQIWRHV